MFIQQRLKCATAMLQGTAGGKTLRCGYGRLIADQDGQIIIARTPNRGDLSVTALTTSFDSACSAVVI
jgi:hypothetical protein